MWRILLTASLAGCLAPLATAQVGLVMHASDGRIWVAGTRTAIALRPGELLYPGDRIEAGAEAITVRFCPTRQTLSLAPGTVLRLEAAAWLRIKGAEPGLAPAADCVLPSFPRGVPEAVAFRGARAAGSVPADAAPVARGDVAAHLARAAERERSGQWQASAAEYEGVAALLPAVDWPRLLVHERKLRKPSPAPAPRTRTIGASAREPGPPRTYALLVGVSDYQRLPVDKQLKYAHRDAAAFADFLRTPRGGALPEKQIRLLVNAQATTAAIRDSIDTFLRARAGPEDTVIVFLAAHGIVDQRGAHIVTHDSDLEDLSATALPMSEIQSLLEGDLEQAGRVLLFVDVCRAGVIGSIQNGDIARSLAILARDKREVFGALASGPKEYSFESDRFGGGHGAFSYFLLDGLNGGADANRDKHVDSGELFDYVRDRVREATARRQTPRSSGNLERTAAIVPDLNVVGIQIAAWRPIDVAASPNTSERAPDAAKAALDSARSRGASTAEIRLAESRLSVALQDRGQAVLLRYLQGERTPQRVEDFRRGQSYFEAALEIDPDAWALRSRALFCEGRVRIFEKRYGDAVTLLERAVRIEPEAAYAWNALGIAYLETGEFDRAADAFRDAMERAPHWVYPAHNLALALAERGDYDAVIAAYRSAMRLAPNAFYLPYNLGLLYMRLNRKTEAREALTLAARLEPNGAEADNALGLLEALKGKAANAERFYRSALAKNPLFLAARHNLALLDTLSAENACALLAENVTADATFLPSRLALAERLAAMGKQNDARRQYEEALRQQPANASARLALAGLLIAVREPDAALAQLRRLPANAAVLERIGDAEQLRGERASAREAYGKALQSTTDRAARKRLNARLSELDAKK